MLKIFIIIMKEININIEGYNVNGICVGCLNYNRKMFYCKEVKEYYKLLGDIDVPDGLSIQVCWCCMASIRQIKLFKEQIQHSYNVLIDYSTKHTFLNLPSDLTSHAINRLSTVSSTSMVIGSNDLVPLKIEVKDEDGDEDKPAVDDLDINEIKLEPDHIEDSIGDDLPIDFIPDQDDHDSDDDIQLSKLQKKKHRKKKKNNFDKITTPDEDAKLNRKLKNLPKDLVQLYIMNEEEMLKVREMDLLNSDFAKFKFRCNSCVMGFRSQKRFNEHMSGKHLSKGADCTQCNICQSYILTKECLSAHKQIHYRAYACKSCQFMTTVKHNMICHVETHEQFADAYKCTLCGLGFNTKSKLTYHKAVCSQERPQCDCCGKVFANKMTLKYHLKNKSISPDDRDMKPKEVLNIPCKGCGKVFTSKKSYRSHVVVHSGVLHPCPECGKLFQWKRNLSRHVRAHRERAAGAAHYCTLCAKRFASRDSYHNHLKLSKRHVSADRYEHECSYCGKKYTTNYALVDHVDWEHLEKIKYRCSFCFKAFKTSKIMQAHVNNIHGNKANGEPDGEHLCDLCGKSYKTVKRLKGHVSAMHVRRSVSKVFKCKVCPATFVWQTSIYKHMKMHAPAKKAKQPELPKKSEPYPVTFDLGNRMQYFQMNLANTLAQNVPHTPQNGATGIVHNI